MAQLFHPSMNTVLRLGLLVLVLSVGGGGWLLYRIVNEPALTGVGVARIQPLPFSHRQHVGELGLDCRYCHSSVETANSATVPATDTCMGCHSQVATDLPSIAPLHESLEESRSLAWVRVHDLADYVYFDHSAHVSQGVGCETCHGRIDRMEVVAKAETLQMSWCLDCHRDPAAHLRPRDAVTVMGWEPAQAGETVGRELIDRYGIHVERLSDCSVCHR